MWGPRTGRRRRFRCGTASAVQRVPLEGGQWYSVIITEADRGATTILLPEEY